MRVVLLGWSEDLACGASDYTAKLARALRKAGVQVELPDSRKVNIRSVAHLLRTLRLWEPDVVHLQYPAMAYRLSIAPMTFFIGGSWGRAITVHEFSESHVLRKMMTLSLLAQSDLAVFTTRQELNACSRLWRWIRAKAVVIPIGSNVEDLEEPEQRCASERTGRDVVVAYFGLIRERKGLEEFVNLARRAKEEGYKWRFLVLGKTPRGSERFEKRMKMESRRVGNIEWRGPAPEGEVVNVLRGATAVYLPYPDGVSERRGSLLAALAVGVPVVTREGGGTTTELRQVAIVTRSIEDSLLALRRLAEDEELRKRLSRRGHEYLEQRSWERIALRHVELYQQLVDGLRRPMRAGEWQG